VSTGERGNFGMTARFLDVIISEKGLFYVLEYLRRRFPLHVLETEMRRVQAESRLVQQADEARAGRSGDAERRG
jgi:hypothetical protein